MTASAARTLKGAMASGHLLEGHISLLELLASYAKRYGDAWPTTGTLATQLGVSRRTVQRWLARIAAVTGYDMREPRFRRRREPDWPGQRRQTSNRFLIDALLVVLRLLLRGRAGASTAPRGSAEVGSTTVRHRGYARMLKASLKVISWRRRIAF